MPKRQTSWRTFLRAHWDVLAAIDFTTIAVWTRNGLVTYYRLFVLELATRRVHFAGMTANPDERWMKQIARNLTAADGGFLNAKRYMLMDRDAKFCPSFRTIVKEAGIEPVLLPPQSPNCNAHLERFHRSLKEECLDRMIFFGELSLRQATREYLEHYHRERNHQGLNNRLLEPDAEVGKTAGTVQCRERLGGLLRYYQRAAA
jgi:transposase InsO family protein